MKMSEEQLAEDAKALLKKRREEDITVIKNPSKWPMWPVMPMKKREEKVGFPWKCGCILALEGYMTTIILDDGKIICGDVAGAKTYEEVLTKFPNRKNYESLEAMFADGWECD